ncbi:hypothetical protein EGJ27_02930 [Pseudomonas sp. v388]|uniref:hypothetical protein n=1 Tax=Pseudomonas sp. v388 TaxID=2479849 RepID=UPI000F7823E1|nr:hypothetical protein [Pseudomonas sp. v388]RRV10585.1 hypothetical protein EGJ27_02930 [Pseudomonas sp. v388]
MHTHTINYRFKDTPRQHQLEIGQQTLEAQEAAMHVLELHFGDGENSLMIPNADATSEDILAQAAVVGLTDIRVVPGKSDSLPAMRS